jgi:hypothetical protein
LLQQSGVGRGDSPVPPTPPRANPKQVITGKSVDLGSWLFLAFATRGGGLDGNRWAVVTPVDLNEDGPWESVAFLRMEILGERRPWSKKG